MEVRTTEMSRRALGEEHSDTLGAIGNLAVTYWKQGRWRKAEELEVKVIVSRRMVGEEHEDTLDVTGNLAATHREQGRLKEADDLHVKVIDASRRVLDAEHPGHNQGDR